MGDFLKVYDFLHRAVPHLPWILAIQNFCKLPEKPSGTPIEDMAWKP